MNKTNVIAVVRVVLGLIAWYLVYKCISIYIENEILDRLLGFTLGMGAFALATIGMPRGEITPRKAYSVTPTLLGKAFLVQTGIACPCAFVVNALLVFTGHTPTGMTFESISGQLILWIFLLLVFHPVVEEVLFRKLVLERLSCLGFKGAVICSAVLFAVPHLFSQGVAQVPYTFALGLVWAYVFVKTKKLWPGIVLHSLSNLYGAFLPMVLTSIHQACAVLYVLFTFAVMLPCAVILLVKEGNSN